MSLRLFSYPGTSRNPYLQLFYEALEPYGVEHDAGFVFSPRWVLSTLGPGDVLHFHWPEMLWSGNKPKRKNILKLWLMLKAARLRGVKVIWTVHNFDLFEEDGTLDRLALQLLARSSDLLIVHRLPMVEWVRDRFKPSAPVVVMPHGNYGGYYPAPRPRAEVLGDLGLTEDHAVFCCLGRMREYKGLDISCEAIAQLTDDLGPSAVHLVVAGKPHAGFETAFLEEHAERLPSFSYLPRMISDQEMIDILSVSEAIWLPFRQITGSGTLLLAWSHGCGVIASDLEFFREIIPADSDAGMIIERENPQALVDAVRAYLARPRAERAAAARAEAAKYDWDKCVLDLGAVLRQWQGTAPARQPRPDAQPVT
ncbi:MAG: glycosyltransferase family 4 protein [Bacteroidota bacterium]